MPTPGRTTSIWEIARSLIALKKEGQPPVLFLGSRAGSFFGNVDFYDILQNFSLLNFDKLSEGEKFQECYSVLSDKLPDKQYRFDESNIREILMRSLQNLYYREENKSLARIMKAGLFDTILTTNIDSLLEDGFWSENGLDLYQIFVPGASRNLETLLEAPGKARIVKIFGDLQMRCYCAAGQRFSFEASAEFEEYLAQQLSGNVVIMGYDPIWDQEVERVFPLAGGTVWYINEDVLVPGTRMAQVVEQRGGQFLEGMQGSHKYFWQALYDHIKDDIQREVYSLGLLPREERGESSALEALPSSSKVPAPAARSIFISYSHKDEAYRARLESHLRALFQNEQELLIIWSDRDIQAGVLWQGKIEQALRSASIAILLVSADFLASDPIREHELPLLLQAARERKMMLFSVILSPCAWKYTEISHYQVVNSLSEPLEGMTPYERESLWTRLAQQAHSLLDL